MAIQIVEADQASPLEAVTPYLDRIEERIREAAERIAYAHNMLDAVDEGIALIPRSRDELLALEGVEGQVTRRVDRLRGHLAQAASGVTSAATGTITPKELASAIGQSEHTTRRLLDKGLIPDARRKTPNVKNSPWIIPASAPTEYLASHNGKEK